MESAEAPIRDAQPLDPGLLAAAAKSAAAAARACPEPSRAVDAAVAALYDAIAGINPSVFVLELGRLWLVAQRGYAVVPDGIRAETGIMGRSVRLGRPQLVADVGADADYVPALPGVRSELAVPLRAGRLVGGALNIESERPLPEDAAELVRPLVAELAPRVEAMRASRRLDLAGLARLFVQLGSLRDSGEIAALGAASLPRVLPVEASSVFLWDDSGSPYEIASWRLDGGAVEPLDADGLVRAREHVHPMVVCQVLERARLSGARHGSSGDGALVWLPLRANGDDLGALVGVSGHALIADAEQLDAAAVLAAHVAASLDAAVVIERERQSAVTDSLTGILNRRGLEERLEEVLEEAHEKRVPVSLLVMDADDFKEINDRAGHEFGDALLVEIARAFERSLPDGAEVGRLGGDEFVVVLRGAGIETAEDVGRRIREDLAAGLSEAGYPLRISVGIATYPFDGPNATSLLRAADQAMYVAKSTGKDRVSTFRDVARPQPAGEADQPTQRDDERRRGPRTDGSVLAETIDVAKAIEAEHSSNGVCSRLCKALVFVVGATACTASRVQGEYLVGASMHALRDVPLGEDVAYRITDFPLTAEVLGSGEPRAISFLDQEVDPAEAFILRELDMNALLMLPLRVRGRPWGLVELYEMRLRRFTEDDVAVALFLVEQAERRLAAIGVEDAPPCRLPVYELPSPGPGSSGPGAR